MEKKILIKGNIRRAFSPRAAEIAIRHMGWIEPLAPIKPSELLTKTIPPEITKPVKLIQPPQEELIQTTKEVTGQIDMVIVVQNSDIDEVLTLPSVNDEPEKKARKKRTPSKSKK